MANPIASILNMGSKALKGAKNVGGKALDAAGRAALYSQTFNNPNEKMGMGKRIGGALFKATVMDTLGDMGTLGQAVAAGMLSRGDKSRSKKETTGGSGVGPTTIPGNPIQGEDVVKAISESTQQMIRGLNILNTTFRQGLNATTNQIQAQSDVLGDIRTNTANSDNKLRDIYEQLNLLGYKNNGSKNNQELVPLEKEGATPQSDQGSILSSLAPGLLGMLPALLAPAMGIIAGGAAAFLADMGLGYLGVGGNELDEKRDDENWDRMNWWQKIESGLARTVENVGGFIAPNIANEAASNRIAAESKYFDEQDGKIKNPNKTRAEAIQQKPPKPTDAKAINKKAVITMGEDAGKEITVLWMHNDGMYEIEYPDGKRTKAGKRTFKFLDNTSSVPGEVNVAQNTATAAATAVASDAPAGSYYVPSEIEEDRSDLENKNELLKDFAARMGIDTSGGLTGSMQGGVPVEINGQKVPEELYTDDQKRNVEGARLIQSMMNPAGMTAEGIDSAEGNMTSGEYLANRQQQFDAQRNQTSEGLLREREKEYEASIKKMLDIVKYEAREVLFDADNIKFDAAKIEFNQSGEGGDGGEGDGAGGPGGPGGAGGPGGEGGGGEGGGATKVPELSSETKTAAEQLQGGNAVRVEPGKEDPLGQYSEEQLRSQNIVSHTNADGTKVYNYVPGGVGGHADKIGGSGATEEVPKEGSNREELGFVSAKYESQGKVDTVSSGVDDPGGVSYGKHQLSSTKGTMGSFLKSDFGKKYAGRFEGMTPGSAEFSNVYKQVAKENPEEFAKAQKDFIDETHYKPLEKYAKEKGWDTSNPKVQEALYSMSVQHSGAKKIIDAAGNPGADVDSQVNQLYDSRSQYVEGLSTLPAKTKASVLNRFKSERKDVLGMQTAPAGDTTTAASGPTARPPSLVAGLQGMQPANAPTGNTASSPIPVDPNQVIADVASGKLSPNDGAVKSALSMLGMNENKDRNAIMTYLKSGGKNGSIDPATTAWCAAFVNASLAKAGIQGSGSNVASNFKNWGEKVEDYSKIKAGDVVVNNKAAPGQTGAHVEIASGPAYQNDKGQWVVPTIGGNTSSDATGHAQGGRQSAWVAKKERVLGSGASQFEARAALPEYYSQGPVVQNATPETKAQVQSYKKEQEKIQTQAQAQIKPKETKKSPVTPAVAAKSVPKKEKSDLSSGGQLTKEETAQLDQVFKNDVTAPTGSANFGNQMSAQQPPVPATPVEPNREAAAAAAVPEMSRKSALADAESKKQGPVVQNFNNTNAPKSDMISNDGVNKNSPKVAITDHMDKHLSYLFGAAA